MKRPKTLEETVSSIITSASLPPRQERIDRELAEIARQAGCACGGVLHVANFPRKCLVVLAGILGVLRVRFSFCCAVCRSRRTPPSVRFLGRRQYGAVLVLLLGAARSWDPKHQVREMSQRLGVEVSEATLARWASWWRHEVPRTPWWQVVRSRFATAPAGESLAAELVERFGALAGEDNLLALLRFLGPLTTTPSSGSGRGFSMGG